MPSISRFRLESLPTEIRFQIYTRLGLTIGTRHAPTEKFEAIPPTSWLDAKSSLKIQDAVTDMKFYVPGFCEVCES